MLLQEERELVVEYGKEMIRRGLTVGTFGNLSVYNEKENLFAISSAGRDDRTDDRAARYAGFSGIIVIFAKKNREY